MVYYWEELTLTNKRRVRNIGLTENIRKYIINKLVVAQEAGVEYIDIRSGDIHKEMGLENCMPPVCDAMESLGLFNKNMERIHNTPSGRSSTKIIRYYLK